VAANRALEFTPIRIGAIVKQGGELCSDCGPEHLGQQPHLQPYCRFTLLVYMPVITSAPSGMANAMPFIGHQRTPPVDIGGAQTTNHPAAAQFVRFLNWN